MLIFVYCNRFQQKIQIGDHLQARSEGKLNTVLDIDHNLILPLKGKYLADLGFEVETSITVNINYETMLKVDAYSVQH